jgi:hypothetical protein
MANIQQNDNDTIFSLETQNVYAGFHKNRKQLLRALNSSLVKNDQAMLKTLTFAYVLLFAAWSEAQFMQVIHTPNALSETEIDSIKKLKNKSGIGEAWKKLIQFAFKKVSGHTKEVKKKEARLLKIVEDNVIPNSLLRNKIAHGQLTVALNKEHTAKNESLTNQLNELDYVQVDFLFQIQQVIGFIVRDLLQSPERGHFRYFWKHDTDLQSLLDKKESQNKNSKLQVLESRAILRAKKKKMN